MLKNEKGFLAVIDDEVTDWTYNIEKSGDAFKVTAKDNNGEMVGEPREFSDENAAVAAVWNDCTNSYEVTEKRCVVVSATPDKKKGMVVGEQTISRYRAYNVRANSSGFEVVQMTDGIVYNKTDISFCAADPLLPNRPTFKTREEAYKYIEGRKEMYLAKIEKAIAFNEQTQELLQHLAKGTSGQFALSPAGKDNHQVRVRTETYKGLKVKLIYATDAPCGTTAAPFLYGYKDDGYPACHERGFSLIGVYAGARLFFCDKAAVYGLGGNNTEYNVYPFEQSFIDFIREVAIAVHNRKPEFDDKTVEWAVTETLDPNKFLDYLANIASFDHLVDTSIANAELRHFKAGVTFWDEDVKQLEEQGYTDGTIVTCKSLWLKDSNGELEKEVKVFVVREKCIHGFFFSPCIYDRESHTLAKLSDSVFDVEMAKDIAIMELAKQAAKHRAANANA